MLRHAIRPAHCPLAIGLIACLLWGTGKVPAARAEGPLRGSAPVSATAGLALLEEARSTQDAATYQAAEVALTGAIAADPKDLDAQVGLGMLAAARHHFAEALMWADRVRAVEPDRPAALGLGVDALVELGRYDEAVDRLQRLVDRRPDMAALTRVSYLRELHGDVPGAIAALRQAADTGLPGSEPLAWALVHLGHLQIAEGDLVAAEASYRRALAERPTHAPAELGRARLAAIRGDLSGAEAAYRRVLLRMPLPEVAVALGELAEASQRPAVAARHYDLARAMYRLASAGGTDVAVERAAFEAQHGHDAARSVVLARAAYARRPTVQAADALAWALYRLGDLGAAQCYSRAALRLGSIDPSWHQRAGMILLASGERTAGLAELRRAMAEPLRMPPWAAAQAAAVLARQ